jgi:hypothetical protein
MNLNSSVIKELCDNNEITIIRKSQKTTSDFNYFLSPNLTVNLYGGRVMIITKDYIVLEFSKLEKEGLYIMLKTIDKYIINYLKECFSISEKNTIYSLYSETDAYFTLRISLPNYKYKYSIKCYDKNDNQIPFKLPIVNEIIKESILDIRNLWNSNNRIGYNLQLKIVKN